MQVKRTIPRWLAWSVALLVLANVAFLACSSAPQYEGGGRHIGDTVFAGSGSAEGADSGADSATIDDTFVPDNVIIIPDTSPPKG